MTDCLSRDEDGLRVLLTGCDEVGAARALRRAPVPPAAVLRLASTPVLCGTGEDGLV